MFFFAGELRDVDPSQIFGCETYKSLFIGSAFVHGLVKFSQRSRDISHFLNAVVVFERSSSSSAFLFLSNKTPKI